MFRAESKEAAVEEVVEAPAATPAAPPPGPAKTKKKPLDKKVKEKDNFKHPWLITSLKVHTALKTMNQNKFVKTGSDSFPVQGHSGRVTALDLSPNGSYLAFF